MISGVGHGDGSEDTSGHGEAFARARAGVIERLRVRRSEIDEAIFARVSDRWFDRAGGEDPEYVVGLRAAGVAALDYVLIGLERSGKSLEPVPAAALAQARRAARAGVGLETVLRRYLAGYALLERFVIQEVERGETEIPSTRESVLRDLLQSVSALVDRLIVAVSSAYGKEIERAGEDGRLPSPRNTGSSLEGMPRERGSRRDSILAAIVEVVAERGYARASVALVLERARVSRHTFYELFPGGLDDGLVAVMDMALQRIGGLVSPRLEEDAWQDGVRAALAALLVFFDSEPALTRVCIVDTLGASPMVVEHREGIVRAFRGLIVARIEREIAHVPPLAAESAIASVMGIIYSRLIAAEQRLLIELLGPLMGTAVAPFAAGEEMIAEEQRRGDELAREIRDGDPRWSQPAVASGGSGSGGGDDEVEVPGVLLARRAHRLRMCLCYVAERGGWGSGLSNQEVAEGIGVCHGGQVSALLGRLAGLGLVCKRAGGPGRPNAWSVSPEGERVVLALADDGDTSP